MTNYDFGITAGLYAERPASSDPTIKIGFRWFSTDTRVLSTLLVDGAGTRYWAEGPNAPVDINLYVSAAGNDLNSGTIGSPLATIQEALHRAGATGWTRRCRVNIIGTINIGTDPTLYIPVASMGGEPVCFMGGTWTDSGLGTLTAGGGTQGSNTTTPGTRGTITGLTLGATNYIGYKIRWITGALAGLVYWVAKNDATSITAHNPFASAPLAGDTFVLEVPSSIIAWTGSAVFAPNGGTVTFYNGIELSAVSGSSGIGLQVVGGRVNFMGCRIRGGSNMAITPYAPTDMSFGMAGTSIQRFHPDLTVFSLGTYFQNIIFSPNFSSFDFLHCVMNAARTQQTDRPGFVFYRFCSAQGASSCVVKNGCNVETFNAYFDGVTSLAAMATAGAIAVGSGSAAFVSKSTNIDNSTVHGMVVEGGASAQIGGLTGTGNNGFGLFVGRGAKVYVSDANTGTTITGSSGNVSVGANGAKTWVLILGGLAVDTTDMAHASSQMVRVGP